MMFIMMICGLPFEKHDDSLIQMVLPGYQSPLEDRLKVSKDLLCVPAVMDPICGNGSKIIETPWISWRGSLRYFMQLWVLCADGEGEDEEEHLQIIETCSGVEWSWL